MLGRLCAGVPAETLLRLSSEKLQRSELIDCACHAADFMLEHAFRDDGLVYFSLSESGEPYHFERKMFSACFMCMGLGALAGHTDLPKADIYRAAAIKLLHLVIDLSHDTSPFGRPKCTGAPATSPMNIPMILLNVIDEIRIAGILPNLSSPEADGYNYDEEDEWCVKELLKHVIPSREIVLENVGVDGSVLQGYDGRHMNPGHAIEAGWFILAYARRVGRSDLKVTAINMIEWSFAKGWDSQYGGLFYMLDSEGRSPPYLEWNMKLWWPHTEAMIAYAMLYEETRDPHYWDRFLVIYDYTISHFSDATGGGEWFGYLDRSGSITHRFKGGPYKGCFHVPRGLYFVEQILNRIEITPPPVSHL
jgi:N-acylglucosamine 2-epimerase